MEQKSSAKPIIVQDLTQEPRNCKEEDEQDSSCVYKIRINNMQVVPTEKIIEPKESVIQKSSSNNINGLSSRTITCYQEGQSQKPKTKSVRLDCQHIKQTNKNFTDEESHSKVSKTARSIKQKKSNRIRAEIQKKMKSQNFKDYHIDHKENGDFLVTMQSGKKVLIRNSSNIQELQQILPGWQRQNRNGFCCFSMHKDSLCFGCGMISSMCMCIQDINLCCYCPEVDCSYCCVTDCCRDCCFQKTYPQCCLECCKSLPCCSVYDCLVNGKQLNCNCLKTTQKVFCATCMCCGKCICIAALCLCVGFSKK